MKSFPARKYSFQKEEFGRTLGELLSLNESLVAMKIQTAKLTFQAVRWSALATGTFLLCLALNGPPDTLAEESVTTDSSTAAAPFSRGEATGPWGKIEYYPVILEPPADHLWAALYDDRTLWNFGSVPEEGVYDILETSGFSKESIRLLKTEGQWKTGVAGTEVDVNDAVIESMTPENRAALAKWFRLNNEPFFSRLIINLEGGNLSAFEEGNVSPKTLDLIRKMTFKRRNVLSLMDRAYIIRQLGDDQEEKERFLKAAFATRSLIVRLVINESTDLESVIDYWSSEGRNPGIEHIIKGVKLTAGVDKLDLVQVLPPLPRRYLFGFTNLRDMIPLSPPDCFWASVQFFRPNASPRILDPLTLNYHLDHDFEKIESAEPQFGDIVCMFNTDDNTFLHSYVHIAADIVFTKNGSSFTKPYVLAKKSDMLSVYLDEAAYRSETYRRKERE